MAVVGKGEKRGYVNKKGEVVIKLQFEEAESFSEGMAAVILDGRSVIIGKTGKTVLEPRGFYASSFHEGYAVVYSNGNKTYKEINDELDQHGNDPKYKEEFKDKLKISIIDRQGKVVYEMPKKMLKMIFELDQN